MRRVAERVRSPKGTLVLGLGLAAVVIAVALALTFSVADEAQAGRQRVPKLPARTYTNSVSNTTGLDVGNSVRLFTVSCDTGDHLLSGGFRDLDAGTEIVSSFPGGGGEDPHWTVEWRNDGSLDQVTLFAYCSDFAPAHT